MSASGASSAGASSGSGVGALSAKGAAGALNGSLEPNAELPLRPQVCTCTAPQIHRYLSRLSGPLLDKIDITIEVHPADAQARLQALPSEDSKTVQARVVATRDRQYERGPKLNAQLKGKALRDVCKITEDTQRSLEEAKAQFSFSRSRCDSLLRVARTIADMDGSEAVEQWHFEEAVNYRPFDRKIFV